VATPKHGQADAGEYYLYIVRCADGSLYTGIATDVARRIREHESGARGAKYLRGKGPLRLEFTECLGDRSIASQVEFRVKQLDRAHKEKLIDGCYPLRELLGK
jgi:putative endonuclease